MSPICLAVFELKLKTKAIHPKYYIQTLGKKVHSIVIWADKNGLVSGRLACTSNKPLHL